MDCETVKKMILKKQLDLAIENKNSIHAERKKQRQLPERTQ